MNIATYSPALTLLYVFALLWILMGISLKSIGRRKRCIALAAAVLLCIANHILRDALGHAVYGRYIMLILHLPTFLLFLYIARRGVVKTAFMILTALVFTAPTVIISNLISRSVPSLAEPFPLLLINLLCYALMLLAAKYLFQPSFNYLIAYSNNRFFLMFSLVPIIYYIYVLAIVNLDFGALPATAAYLVRFLPTANVFLLYFLLPYIYHSLSERMLMQNAQDALQQKLISSESQITLLNEANMRMAVYRHDIRHQFILLDGLLSGGKVAEAQELLKEAVADLDAITPQRFCENETVNLLCSSYAGKAQQLGIRLKIALQLPAQLPLSDIELCSVVSNGLENAMQAAEQAEAEARWVEFQCKVRQNKLLISIQNPYTGSVVIDEKGLPLSAREGHGYGCHSIQTIVQRNGGLCSFEAEDGLFTLRLMLPLPADR